MTSVSSGRRADRTAVLLSLAAVTAIAWTVMARLAAAMAMPAMSLPAMSSEMAGGSPSAPSALVLVVGMWAAMMVGMMVPSAAPMVVTFTDWTRRGPASGSRVGALTAFLGGYLLVWLGFSLLAALLQVLLERAGLLTAMGATTRPVLSGGLLVLAGLFQVSPWKESCLSRCRTPLGFLIAEWREGAGGALKMGVRHGRFCLGCCWALMAVLFVVGTMNLVWMAVIAVFVLVEKIAPRALRVRYLAAAMLMGSGALVLLGAGA